MSTKTSIKRIALVAVSALGFGVLSLVPASAAPSPNMTVSASLAGPLRSGNTSGVAIVWSATSLTGAAIAGVNAKNFNMAYVSGPSGATSASLTLTRTADGVGGASQQLVDTTEVGTTATTVVQTPTAATAANATAVTTASLAAAVGAPAGTYTYQVWYDGDASGGSFTGNDPYANVTFIVAGAPASLDLTANQTSAADIAATFSATLKDVNGTTTQALGTEGFTITKSDSGASTGTVTGTLATADLDDGTASFTVSNDTAGAVTTLTITPNSALTAPAPGGVSYAGGTLTRTLTNGTANASAAVEVTITSGASASSLAALNAHVYGDGTAPASGAGNDVNYYMAQTSSKSFTVTVTGATASSMVVLRATTAANIFANGEATSATAITGAALNGVTLTLGTTDVASAADESGTATFTLTVPATTTPAEPMAIALVHGVGTAATADYAVLGYAASDYHFTFSAPLTVTYGTTGSSPATTTNSTPIVKLAGETTVVTGTVEDQFGNKLANASVSATNTGGSTATKTATAVTDINGAFSITVPAFTTTETSSSLAVTASAPGVTSVNSDSYTFSGFTHSTSGTVETLTVTDSDATGTTDLASSRKVPVVDGARVLANDLTTEVVSLTIATTTPAGVTYTATAEAGSGIRLYTSDPKNAVLTSGDADGVVAGTGVLYAVITKVGSGTITVTAGGLTKVFTLTGTAPTTPSAQLVTLTAGTNANGSAEFTVTTTDIFGNPVAADVNLVLTGAGALSNGFKNMTITTTASGTNTFSVTSDGSAASGITATIASSGTGAYQEITATEATASGVSASDSDATASVTVVQPVVPAKSAEVLASEAAEAEAAKATTAAGEAKTEAAAATAAATTAGDKADAATAAATTAGEKADAAKTEAAAATAAAKAAEDAAAKAGTDAVAAADAAKAEAVKATDAALDAVAAAKAAGEAAVAAAVKAALDAVAASQAAQEAAVAQAAEAYDAALEAIDASNAATDAANLAAEAADAATVAAEEARDAADAATAAIEELATQVSTLFATLRAQITTLGNTVAKIAKKVKA